ncbi:hypothetical protein ALON55S_08391 [Alishewanella longhuensis]
MMFSWRWESNSVLTARVESEVERIAVTGLSIIYANNTGSSSFFGTKDIENAPSF